MLQQKSSYSDTNNIARDAFKVCSVLGRGFVVYKNDTTRYVLRCRDCKGQSCFEISAKPRVTESGDIEWSLLKVCLEFSCTISKTKRQYTSKQLLQWGVMPTAKAYIPTKATGRTGGGQVQQLATMVQQSDKITLKKTQTLSLLDAKRKDTNEVQIQQFGLLHSYLQEDLQHEVDSRHGYLEECNKRKIQPEPSPIGAYVLDTEWTMFEGGELPTFVRLMYTTGYAKAYWQSAGVWMHAELDMCHIKNVFGGCISLLTHANSKGRNKILAFGIHPTENKKEWTKFYDFCQEHFKGISHITNDQDKGLNSIEQQAMCYGDLKRVSYCILHMVRNETTARLKAGAGGFSVSLAGGTVQQLATKLAKACTDEVYHYYLNKMKLGNTFTASFFMQRRLLFSTSTLLDFKDRGKKAIRLSGPIPAGARRGKVTTNTAEQSNSNNGINVFRDMPVLDMVKGIATKMASQHFKVIHCTIIF